MGDKKQKKAIKKLFEQLERMDDRLAGFEQRLDSAVTQATDAAPAEGGLALGVPAAPAGSQHAAGGGADDEQTAGLSAVDTVPDAEPPSSPLWALKALKAQLPDRGGVVYAVAAGLERGQVEYQWGRPTEHLLGQDWSELSDPLSALGHPLRLAMLRLLLEEDRTVAQLVDLLQLGSTGIAYHHLSALQSGGWVTSPQRGIWTLPPGRATSLLTIITALETP